MSECSPDWNIQDEQESPYDGPCGSDSDQFISLGGLEWVTLGNLVWEDKS